MRRLERFVSDDSWRGIALLQGVAANNLDLSHESLGFLTMFSEESLPAKTVHSPWLSFCLIRIDQVPSFRFHVNVL
jgi:hypothetical protein